MELLFAISALGAVFSYVLYPVILKLVPSRPDESAVRSALPSASLVIAARNEGERIGPKLENALEVGEGVLEEIVVVSDESDDGTDDIVRSFAHRGVRLVRQSPRRGKESGQRIGISETRGEAIVFSDVATRIAPGSLQAMVERLAEPGVGAVSSEDRFESRDGTLTGEGAYVRYEMWLRRVESRRAGLVGLSGSLFAARRVVCEDWRTDIPSDFNVALSCVRHGLRAVSDPAVIGVYPDLKNEADEFARKRRTVVRGMAALAENPEVLNPFRFGLFAFEVWGHKLMRWLVPWFLIVLLPVSLALTGGHWIFRWALYCQLAFYGIALIGWLLPGSRKKAVIKIPFYFMQVNLAILAAGIDFLRGRRVVTWNPSKR